MTVVNTNELKINEQYNSKQYDRDFLIKLRDTPQCKVKPGYLINRFLSIHKPTQFRELAGNWNTKVNNFNTRSHHQLLPSFAKPASTTSLQLPRLEKRSFSQENVSRPRKTGMIHVSLSLNESVKLRESENAWKPAALLKKNTNNEEDEETQLLYKKVRGVLNKLTPEKFDKLVGQVRELEIDTQEKLQGVINLVFDKAIAEPNFAVAYALMCKELALMKVNAPNNNKNLCAQEPGNATTNLSFRKLLITRCQIEFEKNKTDETIRIEKLKEIEDCNDPEKKKELLLGLAEYDRRIRIKSVGNIKFIGELYKGRMLTSNIMNLCVNHLLKRPDEENLECLCKLLTTIGKIFEEKNDLSLYFKKLTELINEKGKNKVSSRIRFMIQDVIDLRLNKWIPRHDNNNPKTISQIQREVETEEFINTHLNSSYNNPSKDLRFDNNRKKSLMGCNSSNGWNIATNNKSRPSSYTIQTSKLKINTSPIDDEITLGSKNSYTWKKPVVPLSPNKFSVLDVNHKEEKNSKSYLYFGSRSTGFSEKSSDKSFNSQHRNHIPLMEKRLALIKNNENTLPIISSEKVSPPLSSGTESEIIKSLFDNCDMAAINESSQVEKLPLVGKEFDFNEILNQLLSFMRENNSFDLITNFITKTFGEQPSEPKFCRCLIIAILTVSVDIVNGLHKLNPEKFKQLLPLVIRYVDTDPKRELEVLFGIQHFIHELWYPQGLLSSVVKIIYDDGIISEEAFLSWQKCQDPAEMEGHAIVIKSLTSFFVNLLEGSDDDSEE